MLRVHWKAALQILKHDSGTSGLEISFQRSKGLKLDVSADANYVNKPTDRRSVSGGVGMFGDSAVNWFSKYKSASRFQLGVQSVHLVVSKWYW